MNTTTLVYYDVWPVRCPKCGADLGAVQSAGDIRVTLRNGQWLTEPPVPEHICESQDREGSAPG